MPNALKRLEAWQGQGRLLGKGWWHGPLLVPRCNHLVEWWAPQDGSLWLFVTSFELWGLSWILISWSTWWLSHGVGWQSAPPSLVFIGPACYADPIQQFWGLWRIWSLWGFAPSGHGSQMLGSICAGACTSKAGKWSYGWGSVSPLFLWPGGRYSCVSLPVYVHERQIDA